MVGQCSEDPVGRFAYGNHLVSQSHGIKTFFDETTGTDTFFVDQTRFLTHGGKLVIDRAGESENKSQQHRIIPEDCCSRLSYRTLTEILRKGLRLSFSAILAVLP